MRVWAIALIGALAAAAGWGQAAKPAADLDAILKRLGELTHLPPKGPVRYAEMSRTELRRYLEQRLKEENQPEEIRAQELTLKKFGLLPREYDLAQATVNLLTEQAAAFYDDREKRMVMLRDPDNAVAQAEQIALVHELAHALADQYFDLGPFIRGKQQNDDENLAHLAVAEGQATWLMLEYTVSRIGQSLRNSPEMVRGMKSMSRLQLGQFPELAKAPRYLRETLLFPYAEGLSFQQAVLEKLGDAGFARVFRQPPVSTQQIIHPEAYLSGQVPVQPALPDWEQAGYEKQMSGQLGEFDHQVMVNEFCSGQQELAGQWRGGRFELWGRPRLLQTATQNTVLAYATEWESPEAAQRYFRCYQQMLRKKWRQIAPQVEAANEFAGSGDDGGFTVRLAGNRVTSVEGVGPAFTAAGVPLSPAHSPAKATAPGKPQRTGTGRRTSPAKKH